LRNDVSKKIRQLQSKKAPGAGQIKKKPFEIDRQRATNGSLGGF